MSRAEAFLAGVVQIAAPLTRLQERIVAVKLHPDAVSVLQLHPTMDSWKMERLVSWSLDTSIGRAPVHENYPYLVDQIASAADEAGVDGVDAGIAIPASLFDTRTLTLPYMAAGAQWRTDACATPFWLLFNANGAGLAVFCAACSAWLLIGQPVSIHRFCTRCAPKVFIIGIRKIRFDERLRP